MDNTFSIKQKSNFNSLENSKIIHENNHTRKLSKNKSTPKLNNCVKFSFKNSYNNQKMKIITSYDEENNEKNKLTNFYDFTRNKKKIKNERKTYQTNVNNPKLLPFNINKAKIKVNQKNSQDRIFLSPTVDKFNYSEKILDGANSQGENDNFLKNNENNNGEIDNNNMNIMMYNDKNNENNKNVKENYFFDSTDLKFSPYYKEIYGS